MALRQEGYWDQHYGLELKNYQEDGDEGEVWFGKGLSCRIVAWLVDRLNAEQHSGPDNSQVLDIGCGNSYTLCTLVERIDAKLFGESLKILGIDYSHNSIELSKRIVAERGLDNKIFLEQCDFLDHEQLKKATKGANFDFLIDKGTYDAICLLASQSTETLDKARVRYMESLYSLVKSRSILILASCNSTEEELMNLFSLDCDSKINYKLIGRIETPKIKFGGKEGSQVTCVIVEFL